MVYIASSESCQPNRDLFGVGAKLKESIFKNNNQINCTVTTKKWILSTESIRTWPSTGLVPNEKMVMDPFVSMVDVVLQVACLLYCIN